MTLDTITAEPPPALPAFADIQRRQAELLARRALHQPEGSPAAAPND